MSIKNKSFNSRRDFLWNITGAGSALVLSPLINACSSTKKLDPLANILANTIGMDTHNHIDVPFNEAEIAGLKINLYDALKKSGLAGICMTFAVDRPELKSEGEAYQRFLTGLNAMDAVLKANNIKRALNYSDLKAAHKAGKPIVIQSVEGGHFLEGKIDRLNIAYNRGLRVLGLLHDNQPSVPIGDIYTDAPQYNGLTEFGKTVVKESNKLGILIDLTHCSNKAINDALEISSQPMMVSHTGLDTRLGNDEKMATMMKPRLISKEQAKIVANAGGIVGVWTHLASSPAEYVDNIKAMVDVIGVDHVCIGTDTKMAVAEGSNSKFGKQTNNAWDGQTEGFFHTVAKSMLAAGFHEDEIIKIGGGNFCRIFDEATKNKNN
ncbi:MAG: peptidase M19 [Bacteroidetes bacterium]|nr:peptidase M19 [Bacteroidota bacterium]